MQEIERTREEEKEVNRKEIERKVEKENTLESCPECGSIRLIRDFRRGEFVCQDCGLVIEDTYIDEGPEWRAFDSEQKNEKSRVGAPVTHTFHDKGLSTIIWGKKDFYGKAIPVRNKAQLFRLRKWQRRIRISNATERNLFFALTELDRMSSALGLPKNVKENAAIIYRKVVDRNLVRGRSIEGVVAAALYAACRQTGVPRTLDEITIYSRVDRKEIGRTYRYIARELSLKLMPTSPADYAPRFCAALGLSGEVQKKAVEIIKKSEEKELTSGRSPIGVAAAATYIASILGGEKRTQQTVAEVAEITEVTIRNRYKELAKKLGIEIIP